MSPTDAGRFTEGATVTHRAGPWLSPGRGADRTCVQDGTVSDEVTATDPRPCRPVTPTREVPSRNAHPRPFHDPCNYLG